MFQFIQIDSISFHTFPITHTYRPPSTSPHTHRGGEKHGHALNTISLIAFSESPLGTLSLAMPKLKSSPSIPIHQIAAHSHSFQEQLISQGQTCLCRGRINLKVS